MGWGAIPNDHPLMEGMVELQPSDFVPSIGKRSDNCHTGSTDVYCKSRSFLHRNIELTQIGRVPPPHKGIVSGAKAALKLFVRIA